MCSPRSWKSTADMWGLSWDQALIMTEYAFTNYDRNYSYEYFNSVRKCFFCVSIWIDRSILFSFLLACVITWLFVMIEQSLPLLELNFIWSWAKNYFLLFRRICFPDTNWGIYFRYVHQEISACNFFFFNDLLTLHSEFLISRASWKRRIPPLQFLV